MQLAMNDQLLRPVSFCSSDCLLQLAHFSVCFAHCPFIRFHSRLEMVLTFSVGVDAGADEFCENATPVPIRPAMTAIARSHLMRMEPSSCLIEDRRCPAQWSAAAEPWL